MLTASQQDVSSKRFLGRLGGRVLFPGLVAAAREFGCHHTHLYRVLKGQFPDHHNFRERYAAFAAGLSDEK